MADVFRGPLIIGRRDLPLPTSSALLSVASLLVTTLALAPLPVGAQSFPQWQHASHQLTLSPDTSLGTPKPLFTDAQLPVGGVSYVATPPKTPAQWLNPDTTQDSPQTVRPDRQAPVFVAPQFPPESVRARAWLSPDTTRGTPKGLSADAQKPVFVAPVFGPDMVRVRAWLPADTTADQPSTLKAIVLAPFVPGPYIQVIRIPWLPDDTTQGSPETVRPDAQAPIGTRQIHSAPDRVRPTVDTTISTPLGLSAVVVLPPFIPSPGFAPAWSFAWPTQVVGLGIPKPLVADAQTPIGAAQTHTAADRIRPVTDTTASAPKTLSLDAQRPVGAAQTSTAPDRARPVIDTTLGALIALRAQIAPFAPTLYPAPAWYTSWPTHVALGMPKPLIADAQAPVGRGHMHSAPDRVRAIADTTAGTSLSLRAFIATPPFVPAIHITPTWYVARPTEVVRLGVPKTLTRDAQLPVRNPPHSQPSQRYVLIVDTALGALPRAISLLTPMTVDPFYTAGPAARRFLSETAARTFTAETRKRKFTGKA